MGNLCCPASDENEVKPLLSERAREAERSADQTPHAPPPAATTYEGETSAPPGDDSPGQRGTRHQDRRPSVADDDDNAEEDRHHHHHHHHHHHQQATKKPSRKRGNTNELPLSVDATDAAVHARGGSAVGSNVAAVSIGSTPSALQHPTKHRPRGPLKRTPSRRHHLHVPDVSKDANFLIESQTVQKEDGRRESDEGQGQRHDRHEDDENVERGTAEKRKMAGERGVMALPPGVNPADLRKQLKNTEGAAGRAVAKGPGIGGFDAGAARANLRSTGKKI